MDNTMRFLFLLLTSWIWVGCQNPDAGHSDTTTVTQSIQSDNEHAKSIEMFEENGVRATGNEPFWMLEIKSDSIIFNQMGGVEYRAKLPAPLINRSDSLRFLVTLPEGRMDVLFSNTACIDNMSGFRKQFTTTVSLINGQNETVYQGCADYLLTYDHQLKERSQ